MSFANRTPIREALLPKVYDLIAKHKGKLSVIEYDVQLMTWIAQRSSGPVLVSAWAVVIVVAGALLGRENWLVYTWTFSEGDTLERPVPPDDSALERGIASALQNLLHMQLKQLQTKQTDRPELN